MVSLLQFYMYQDTTTHGSIVYDYKQILVRPDSVACCFFRFSSALMIKKFSGKLQET